LGWEKNCGKGSGGSPLGARNAGGTTRTGLFGVKGEGKKFVYVVDRSESMGEANHNVLKAVKKQLLGSLSRLDKIHQFQIIFDNDRPLRFTRSGQLSLLILATEQNKALTAKFVDSILPEVGTEHEKALETAILMGPDVIFLLTDAEKPRLSAEQLASIQRPARGITIHVIEFGRGPPTDPDNLLEQLARQNGGRHRYLDVSSL
jgi:hypothetical protein